jgi:hypothetical protein
MRSHSYAAQIVRSIRAAAADAGSDSCTAVNPLNAAGEQFDKALQLRRASGKGSSRYDVSEQMIWL